MLQSFMDQFDGIKEKKDEWKRDLEEKVDLDQDSEIRYEAWLKLRELKTEYSQRYEQQ